MPATATRRLPRALATLVVVPALTAAACSSTPPAVPPTPAAPPPDAATGSTPNPPAETPRSTASASPSAAASSASSASSAPSDRAGEPPSTTPPDPAAPDPIAPASPTPVGRPSQAQRLAAVTGPLTGTLRWSDGVTLTVSDVDNEVLVPQGPGSVGGPYTSFRLRLINGSDAEVDATQVVVSLTYGRRPARVATAVYDEQAADFGSRLAPGQRAEARYSFAVPTAGRSRVALTVDLDARHGLATFRGDAR